IERPGHAPSESARRRPRRAEQCIVSCPVDPEYEFYSIGEFYEEIARGFEYLHKELGPRLFSGDPKRQITPEYYYSGGGELHVVTDLASARAAIRLIAEQGEGKGGSIYSSEGELAHYYRFDQLVRGRYYQAKDKEHEPTGPELRVDWGAVYPLKTNARVVDYLEFHELRAAADAFNGAYADFLASLTAAYNGEPQVLMQAVPQMFRLRNGMLQLIHNPLPGSAGKNAAPTFEIAGRKGGTP
ncbi:MAG TPA: ferritin-like domain-containing protein, partial [Polyangiaceae bacterium]|nr:ferritin-like domain-containing protein [Polyangiaceae bacterium]